MSANNSNNSIDIPLDGVGCEGGVSYNAPTNKRSSIDIPLGGPKPRKTASVEAGNISAIELEMVNRHHDEIKELHRRARQGE